MSVTSSQVREMSRPCDLCRRGKRRCDGPEQADRACSRCKQMSKVCSYVDPAEHNRAARHAYITALESRLETVKALLQRHVPDAVLMHELGILAMNTTPASAHQHGTYGGEVVPDAISSFRALEPWDEAIALSHQHPGHDSLDRQALLHPAQQKRRPEFWCTLNYEFRGERLEDRDLDLVLPPPDQLASLTQAYFDHWNPNFPIFHRALFEQQLLNNKSAPDKKFTVAVLLACALGESRLTNYTDHTERGQQPSGWDFFLHVEPFLRVPTPAHPQLLDLQIFFLATLYTAFIKHNFVAWTLFGTAIRLAYLADAHRRDKYNRQQPNLLDELWKRTFWVLVVVDRMGASFYGRPLMMKDESFNLDLPLEVDDTCWDIGAPGFPLRNTPVTKQGSISFFVWHIQLVLILGVSIQTIYSINRSRLLMGFVGSDWEQRITSKIDLMLNAWAEDVPVHLRWDLNATDLPRFCQSSFLEARYHTLRISAHNPFMRTTARDFAYAAPSSRTAAGLTSSLAICTASAVACSEVVVGVVERLPSCLLRPGWIDPPFISGLILLINLFGFKSSLSDVSICQYMKYIEACLEALRIASEHDTVGKEKKDSLKKLMSELQQELPSHLFQRHASPTVPPQNPPAPHWPENRTIPVSPNPQLHRLPPERRMSAQTVNHVQLYSDRSSAQAGGHSSLHTESSQSELSQPSLYLDAIPLGLRDQMSTGLLSPPQLYRSLHTEHIRLRPNRPEDTTFSSM